MFSRKGYSSVKNSMIQQNIPPQHNSNGSKVSRTQAITNQLSIKDKIQSQKTEGNQTIGGIRVRPMRMMSRTSSLNEKVAPNSEVKSCKNSSLMQNGNQSQGAFNFVNTEKKEQFKPSPTKNAGKDKIFPDDKSYATLKTESTNHSNGTGSKGSSEKSSDENTDSQFSSMFFSP
jgi:hypothetical protein